MSTAILLIAHGSRRAAANAELVEIARLFRERSSAPLVEIAYLELTEPTIPKGLERCREQGATSIRLLPYFLSAGAHVIDDLQRFRDEFTEQWPAINCQVCPPLGPDPLLVELLLRRAAGPALSGQQGGI